MESLVRLRSLLVFRALLVLSASVPAGLHAAGAHLSLFDGRTLAGWHAQGDCEWSVAGGAIRGVNPNGNWCHLITDSAYTDYSLDLDYKVVRGNTGLYVRAGGEDKGCCGLEGTQVDIGPSQDGSVMWVKDGAWGWYELITKAPAQGWVDYSRWNTVRVDVKGMGIQTYVNGHPVYAAASLAKMAAKGSLALQLHGGGKGDTILFRNLELYLPARVPGCLDSAYVEYRPEANFPLEGGCRTRKATGTRTAARAPARADGLMVAGLRGVGELMMPAGVRGAELFDARGSRTWTYAREERSRKEAVSLPGHLTAGVYRIRWLE